MAVTIWHNPRCSNSRGALEILHQHGIEPTVIEYLKTPPDRDTLHALVTAMGTGARRLLRDLGSRLASGGLLDVADVVFWLTREEADRAASAWDAGRPVGPSASVAGFGGSRQRCQRASNTCTLSIA